MSNFDIDSYFEHCHLGFFKRCALETGPVPAIRLDAQLGLLARAPNK
jgi:hypothetical protein